MASAYSYFRFAYWLDWSEELAETWHEITLDSYVVDIRRVKKTKEHGYAKAVAEVCKYALKFSDLSLENTWEAFLTLKGKRLTGSFGSMYGVKIPEKLDDMPLDELPYMEMFYRFVFGERSYYDLEITKDVKPNKRNEEGWTRSFDEARRPNDLWRRYVKSWSEDVAGARARSHGTTATKLNKQAYLSIQDL